MAALSTPLLPTEAPTFLILVVDIDHRSWTARSLAESADGAQSSSIGSSAPRNINFEEFMKSLIIFINSYLLVHRQNRLAVLSYSSSSANVVFPDENSLAAPSSKDSFIPTHHLVGKAVTEKLINAFYSSADATETVAMNGTSALSASTPPALVSNQVASCLARAMCSE
jgi:hypothetical protein